jgi:starvation-inducible DNA-binding protein
MRHTILCTVFLAATALTPAVAEPQNPSHNAPLGLPVLEGAHVAQSTFGQSQRSGQDQQRSEEPRVRSREREREDQERTRSPRSEIRIPQEIGRFPTNQVTNRPFVSPGQGTEGYNKTVGALQRVLIELQQLQLQTKQAHWNVSGTLFHPLHIMLQEHYEGLSKYADEVAERLLAIGSSADGRANTIVRTSGVPEIPGGFLDDAQVIVWFTDAYKKVGDEIRAGIIDTNEPDPTTSNLLQEVELGVDKYQWQMRAHVQRTATDPNSGWDLNDNKPVDLPSRTPAVQPGAD